MRMSAKGKLNGGVFSLFLGYSVKIFYFVPILFIWRSLAMSGADLGGLTLNGLLSYTCVSTLLNCLLNPRSPITTWHYEGLMIDLFKRPMRIFAQLIAETAGLWVPELLLFSLPAAVFMCAFGINLIPESGWFILSLLLCVSLGFAIDFLLACFIMRIQNAAWITTAIYSAIMSVFSGAVIPFDLLPWDLKDVFRVLPFGSLAGAPLSLFIGTVKPADVLALQVFWNFVLWPLAILAFKKSRERMVSYGG